MTAASAPRRAGPAPRRMAGVLIVPVLILAIAGAMALVEPRFFSRLNLINVARNVSTLSIVALGQMLVMIVGGFDLSVGAVVALGAVVAATAMSGLFAAMPGAAGAAALTGIAAGILAGGLVGIVNGLVVTKLRVPPFMATLGIASMVVGATFYVTKGVPIYGMPDVFTDVVGRGSLLGLPATVWVGLGLGLLAGVVLEAMPFGRHVYAAGGNQRAARLSGIRTDRVLIVAYAASGAFAALVGILTTARIGSGQSTLGATSAVESIAAAVVGGVSLRGGVGRVPRVMLAALFLALVANALNLARVDSKYQTMVLGVVVLAAVLVERRFSRGGARG